MSKNGHEYSVQNATNRSHTGKAIYSVAAIISALILYILLSYTGALHPVVNAIVSALLTAALFTLIYKLFDAKIWKLKLLFKVLKYPDISGNWSCKGNSNYKEQDGVLVKENFDWEGEVAISQSWDKLRIRLETQYSISESVSAAIIYDELNPTCFTILYNYINTPKDMDNHNLHPHMGFAQLQLKKDIKHASAKYYNVTGRRTLGTMEWTKLD